MIPIDFQTLREGYERELATLFDRIAAGDAVDDDTIRGFGLIAEIYRTALAGRGSCKRCARRVAICRKQKARPHNEHIRQ